MYAQYWLGDLQRELLFVAFAAAAELISFPVAWLGVEMMMMMMTRKTRQKMYYKRKACCQNISDIITPQILNLSNSSLKLHFSSLFISLIPTSLAQSELHNQTTAFFPCANAPTTEMSERDMRNVGMYAPSHLCIEKEKNRTALGFLRFCQATSSINSINLFTLVPYSTSLFSLKRKHKTTKPCWLSRRARGTFVIWL